MGYVHSSQEQPHEGDMISPILQTLRRSHRERESLPILQAAVASLPAHVASHASQLDSGTWPAKGPQSYRRGAPTGPQGVSESEEETRLEAEGQVHPYHKLSLTMPGALLACLEHAWPHV